MAAAPPTTLARLPTTGPEDMEVKTLGNGDGRSCSTATGTHDVDRESTQNTINQFVSRDTIDIATGVAVGSALASPDNLAIDADGNIYIVEDQPTRARTSGSPGHRQ